ncbi:MAG: nitrogen fixation protein NifX [Rhodospirillales bacterium]|nr:nitrogen fixation protein NifX [Rhodospirillales bacterium]
MKVAFATQDMKSVDAHFASARNMAIYDVSAEAHRFIEAVQFDGVSNQDGQHAAEGEDRISAKVDALNGCALLFVLAIGGPAAARVVAGRIHPIKISAPEPIPAVIERIQTMLKGTPPPWMRKILADEKSSMAFLDEEES